MTKDEFEIDTEDFEVDVNDDPDVFELDLDGSEDAEEDEGDG